MVMALRELGQAERIPELGARFGQDLAEGFSAALDEVEATGEIAQRYTVRLREAASIDALLEHMGRGSRTIRVVEESREHDGHHWVVRVSQDLPPLQLPTGEPASGRTGFRLSRPCPRQGG
ncbi:MAG: hypothetical protein U5L11_02075 [Arhodomonas sp.]|nr:hypothetical protein [Arhodomonas sp.]